MSPEDDPFERSVVAELGLNRYPELREAYFRHYRRVVWLAQHPTPPVRAAAAARLGLPLYVIVVSEVGLERDLGQIIERAVLPHAHGPGDA
jgi:hypothetical protein